MRTLVGIAIAIGFVVIVVIAAIGQLRVSCEVCHAYGGGRTCETARAADRAEATQQATTAACAKLTGGVTESIRCGNTPPVSVTCEP